MFDLGEALKNVSIPDTGREQIVYLSLDKLDSDENNFYQLTDIEGLAANIATCGLQQPIRVRAKEGTDRYIIVSGHRRRAALAELQKDDPKKWGEAPCIIESDAVSPALQQLRLIYANAHTRKLTAAEISEQAVQVEKLLYQLKEEGHEFPGRMRDHVAQAVGASNTKLARLKVIRENLVPNWSVMFRNGRFGETVAYALAGCPRQLQDMIYEAFGRKAEKLTESSVHDYASTYKRVTELTCPNHGNQCTHTEKMMKKSFRDQYTYNNCCGCCLECSDLKTCRYSCHKAEGKKARMKQAEADAKQADADRAEARAVAEKKYIAGVYSRMSRALEASQLSLDDYLDRSKQFVFVGLKENFSAYARGEGLTSSTNLPFSSYFPALYAKELCRSADALDCSIDFLLGRDENLKPAAGPAAAPNGWQTGTPPEPGKYVGLVQWQKWSGPFPEGVAWTGECWVCGEIDLEPSQPVVYWMPYPEE